MKFILLLIDEMYFKEKIQYIYCITEKYIILHTHTHSHKIFILALISMGLLLKNFLVKNI